jgi:hypothetical protein
MEGEHRTRKERSTVLSFVEKGCERVTSKPLGPYAWIMPQYMMQIDPELIGFLFCEQSCQFVLRGGFGFAQVLGLLVTSLPLQGKNRYY